MKTKLFFLFLVITVSETFTQNYIPMLHPDNSWKVAIFLNPYNPPNPPNPETLYEYYSIGDIETFNNQDYYRIILNNSPSCLLREDSNGKVYLYDESTNEESLLFDFTLQTGDTFYMAGSAYENYNFCSYFAIAGYDDLTVQSVDYQEIAGQQRKVITFHQSGYYGNFQWIEGIGSRNGFALMWEMIDITDGSLLSCFQNNQGTFLFNGATSCNLDTSNFKANFTSVIFPNPVTAVSKVQFSSEITIDTIKIYDLTGKLISEEKINTTNFMLNRSKFNPGIYFLQFFNNHKLISNTKFVVN